MTNYPIIHLGIDYQPKYLNELEPCNQEAFLNGARQCADNYAALGVPTIWALMGPMDLARYYPAKAAKQPHKLIKDLDPRVLARDGETYLVKTAENALYIWPPQGLRPQLRKWETHTVLVSGMETSACVEDTVFSIAAFGLNCICLYDQMANTGNKPCHQINPETQCKIISDLKLRRTPTQIYGLQKIYKRQQEDEATIQMLERIEFMTVKESFKFIHKQKHTPNIPTNKVHDNASHTDYSPGN